MISQTRNFLCLLIISSCSIFDQNFYSDKKININDDILYSPYAMQTIQINNTKEELMLLNQVIGDKYKWSKDGLRITMSNGKIIKSVGLENDFELNYYKGIKTLDDHEALIRLKNPESDFMEIIFTYSVIDKGIMTKILDKSSFSFTLIEEEFNVPKIRWKGSNLYWVDPDGYVWKTIQHLEPFGSKATFVTLKKYSD